MNLSTLTQRELVMLSVLMRPDRSKRPKGPSTPDERPR